jgi:catechol 2,3-dioxygenase-like lactoylglutathione lyase family enzyme
MIDARPRLHHCIGYRRRRAFLRRYYEGAWRRQGRPPRGLVGVWRTVATAYPDRVYISIRKGPKPEEAFGRHWCFKAKWRTQIDAFWDAGIAAGGSDDGPPGVRNNYHTSYYAAFLRDPDGNRVSVIKRSEGQCKPDNRV